jgi:hypothetical protein
VVVTGVQCVEDKDATDILQHTRHPHNRDFSGPCVNAARVEKLVYLIPPNIVVLSVLDTLHPVCLHGNKSKCKGLA